MQTRRVLHSLGLVTALIAGPSLSAQTITSSAKEAPIELSPFVVISEDDQGYQASKTLSGSRMSTDLKDTAASVSVLTAELIRDIGALDLTEAIAFGNNVELEVPDGNAAFEFFNTFRIRGQASTIGRNYFRWKLPTNTFNAERIEEARGPNSILFGIASAGGMISSSTKQAYTNRKFRRAQLVYGSWDLRRAAVDVNQASDNEKFGVRFNAVLDRSQGYQHFVFNEDTRGHLAAKYNLGANTVIRAEYEKGRTFNNKADNQEIGDLVMGWINAGRPVRVVTATDAAAGITRNGTTANFSLMVVEDGPGMSSFIDLRQMGVTRAGGSALITDPSLIDNVNYTVSLGGPTQTQETDFNTYSVFLDRKFGKNTYLQLAYNHQDYDFMAWQAGNPTGLKGEPNQFLKDGVTPNPHAGQLYFETTWINRQRQEELDNFRLTLSTELDFGKWGEYRLAGLAEREESTWSKNNYNEIWSNAATGASVYNALSNNSVNFVRRIHYITEGDYGTYFASHANPGVGGFFSNVADPTTSGRVLNSRLARASGSDFDDPSEQDSYLLSAQGFYFKRKLVVAGGYRADTLHLHEGARNVRDTATGDFIGGLANATNPRVHRSVDANTRTYGAVFHAFPWLSLRYNNSNSHELANVGARLMSHPDANGKIYGSRVGDNPEGQGEDYGFDLTLSDGRINLRATRFNTTRAGAQGFGYGGSRDNPTVMSNRILDALQNNSLITASERELHQLDSGSAEFDVASTGYEFTLVANPTKSWRLMANYSVTDSVTSNIAPAVKVWADQEIPYFRSFNQNLLVSTGETIAQEIARWQAEDAVNRSVDGQATTGNRREKFSLVTSYSFHDGALKGLNVGATARYQGRQVVAATTAGELLYGNSFTRADAFLRYSFGRSTVLRFLKNASIQLNVLNVLDQHDPLITRFANPNAAVLEVNRLAPQLPRSWRLSAEFAF